MIIDFGSKHGISLKRETGAQQHVTNCGFRSPKIVKHDTGAQTCVSKFWSLTEISQNAGQAPKNLSIISCFRSPKIEKRETGALNVVVENRKYPKTRYRGMTAHQFGRGSAAWAGPLRDSND